jgi:Abnormal spindle-like microcephaly-assoc'd, ASPM-SPD-2-Hydin/Galactose oxidase, central domain
MKRVALLALLLCAFAAVTSAQNTITTVAGGAQPNNVSPTAAGIEGPYGVVRDAGGNLFVFADNNQIYKVTPGTVAPSVMTIYAGSISAGYSGDGKPAVNAALNEPYAGALDAAGNLYFSDSANCVIREINATTQIITTFAGNGNCGYTGDGGQATSATLNNPQGIAFDAGGNLYIVDCLNNAIRRVDTNHNITTVVGDGTGNAGYNDDVPANQATMDNPEAVATDASGNLYIADTGNNAIRFVNAAGTLVTSIVGNGTYGNTGDGGPANEALLRHPQGVYVDAKLNIYISDTESARVRLVTSSNNTINTIIGSGAYGFAGDGGPALNASLTNMFQLAVDAGGDVWVTDYWNNRIRYYSNTAGIPSFQTLTTVVGNGSVYDGGPATSASLYQPRSPNLDASGNLYITDTYNNRIREVNTSGTISTVAGNGIPCDFPQDTCGDGGQATAASFYVPRSVFFDNSGNLIILDTYDNRVRKVVNGVVTTIAGTGDADFTGDGGAASAATFRKPWNGGVDAAGNIYILDAFNNRVRKIDATTGNISTVAGSGAVGCGAGGYSGDGGPATSATLNCPIGLDVDAAGDLYISDYYNFVIRKVDAKTQVITTIVGTPGTAGYTGDGGPATSATLSYADRVSVNGAGNLFISDAGNNVIRRVTAATGIIETFAGSGAYGFGGDGGPALQAKFAGPTGVVVTNAGNLYVGDLANQRVRQVTLVAGATLAPATVAFGNQNQGTTSAAQTVTLTNTGDAPLTIANVGASGDFDVSQNNCTATLNTGANCTILVTFTPSGLGALTGTLTVTDNAPTTGSTQTSALTGTGTAVADFSLTVTPAGTGTGTVTSNPAGINCGATCTANFTSGTAVTLTAAAGTSSTFTGWSGGGCTGTGTCVVTLAANTTVTATFGGAAAGVALSIAKTHTGNFTQGQANAAYTVTVSNAAGSAATSGTVTVTENAPSGLTLVSMAGAGWTCAVIPTCTRTDALAGGASYPAITVLVNVAGSATSPQVNAISVSGGGSATANANDSTTITTITGPTWTNGPNMSVGRAEQTATTLTGGKVLVAGGVNGNPTAGLASTATADLYDPTANTFSAAGAMTGARAQHAAALLTTGTTAGEVLVAGGYLADTDAVIGTAELYNPATNTFATTGNMTIVRVDHTATTLLNGQVLVVGGRSTTGGGQVTATAELFNPATGTFTATTGPMTAARFNHTATLLSNGLVLIAGGRSTTNVYLNTAELYNPATGTFSAVPGTMSSPRSSQTATLLQDGTVLLAGGGISDTATISVTNTADIYNPTTNTFTPVTATMDVARAYHTANLLGDGTVVLAGGGNSSDPSVAEFQALSSVEIYSPATKTFAFAASLNFGRGYQTATLLPSGAVLTEGGFNGTNVNYTVLASSEIYTSSTAAAPVASFAPTSLTFASQALGTTSAAQTVTLTNSGNAALAITGVSITGANAGDYAETNTCPASPATLAAGANCVISVTFTPTATGARTASVSVADNATGSPQTVPLAGTGAATTSTLTFAPTSLTFASQNVGTSSAPQTVVVTNTGTAAVQFTGLAITGTNSGDFALGEATCSPTGTLAGGATCTIVVAFTPSATGARTAAISVADSATGSPQSVPLNGTGANAGTPTLTIAPTTLTFAAQTVAVTSAPMNVTVTNSGKSAAQFTSFSITGTNSGDYALASASTGACNPTGTLAAGANCTIAITFTPTAVGTRTATLSIADNATGSPQAVTLTGTAIAAAVTVTIPSGGSNTATSVPGGTAYFGLVLTAAPGVTGTVTLGCTPSSPLLTCSVIPSTVTLTAGNSTEVAFGVQTYCQGTTTNGSLLDVFGLGRSNGSGGGFDERRRLVLYACFAMLMALCLVAARRNRRLSFALAMVTLLALGSAACSGGVAKGPNGATPAGTYELTLTTTFNGQTQTLPNYLKLVVN